jgi:hypothetical protein
MKKKQLSKPRQKYLKKIWNRLWMSNWTEAEQLIILDRLLKRN